MNKPEYIIIHHTGVSYTKNPNQYEATKRYHKSLGWGDIGYHYEISREGKVYKGRPEQSDGAHTIGMNSKSIAIAMDGNFDIEVPTTPQIEALRGLLKDVAGRYKIPPEKIVPHRKFAKKTCYGSKLADDWAGKLIETKFDTELAKRLDKTFLLSVDDAGRLYYVHQGKKIAVPAQMPIEQFVIENGLMLGITKADLDRIENA